LAGRRKMKGLEVQSISWNRHSSKYTPARRGSQLREQKKSFTTEFPGSYQKIVISYEIDGDGGSIRAEIIDPESGKVVREIDVKPSSSRAFSKGPFFEAAF
jgi:hypothetical protein